MSKEWTVDRAMDILSEAHRYIDDEEIATMAGEAQALLRTQLSQPQPFGWAREWDGDDSDLGNYLFTTDKGETEDGHEWVALYTEPPATQQQAASSTQGDEKWLTDCLLMTGYLTPEQARDVALKLLAFAIPRLASTTPVSNTAGIDFENAATALFNASQAGHNLHTRAWSELTQEERAKWRKTARVQLVQQGERGESK